MTLFEEVLGPRFKLFKNIVVLITLSLKRKRISRAQSIIRSTERMFMLPVSKAKALNIVCWSSMLEIWKNGYAFVFKCLSMALRNQKDLDGMFV